MSQFLHRDTAIMEVAPTTFTFRQGGVLGAGVGETVKP
jgi:hypothetical protein